MQPLTRNNIRLAATILLLRDGPRGLEVFMVQRPARGDFPDLHVFPGGKVDATDQLDDAAVCGLDDAQASRRLGLPAGGRRFWVAAVRECFEECGVLLAERDGQIPALAEPDLHDRFLQYREALVGGALDMAGLCATESLVLCLDRVHYFSHWLTPEAAPRRFDTRFFVARMPDGQRTLARAEELAGDAWVRPAVALDAYRTGHWQMIAPTLTTLTSLADYGSADTALAAVAAETHLPDLDDALREQGMQPLR